MQEKQLARAQKEYANRPFLGGCANAKELLCTEGFAALVDKQVSIWWPGEGTWYDGVVQQVEYPKHASTDAPDSDGRVDSAAERSETAAPVPTFKVYYSDGDEEVVRLDCVWKLVCAPRLRRLVAASILLH
jgi:hypothetical protein